MKVIKSIKELRLEIQNDRNVVLVPTMGNIHKGHLSLLRTAKEYGKTVICSIFVNPLQFGKNEDYDSYPRTLSDDIEKLQIENPSIVFTPNTSEIYPSEQEFFVTVPKYLAKTLEGKYRSGFFQGVTTVVLKLLNCTNPKYAIFGKKDFQQLLIIKYMCEQFCLQTSIISSQTIRESDGLAFSSRNSYLNLEQRKKAPLLYQTILNVSVKIKKHFKLNQLTALDLKVIETQAESKLRLYGLKIDYVKVCMAKNLQPPNDYDLKVNANLIILAACYLGSTRLIDNLELTLNH